MPQEPTYDELAKEVAGLRKRNQHLENNIDELNAIFSLSLDPISVCCLSTQTFTKINPAFVSMLGYSEKELLARPLTDFIHPDDVPSTQAVIDQKLKAGEKVFNFLNRYRCSDGTYRWIQWTSHPIAERDLVFAVGRDITEQRAAEEALKENETFLQTVMDNLPIGVGVASVDPVVSFEYMNDMFPTSFKTTRKALSKPGSFWNAVYEDPQFRKKIEKQVLDGIASGDPKQMYWEDIPITRKGEEIAYINAKNSFIPGKDLLIAIVWDVTKRKQAEDELRETKRLLEDTQAIAKLGGWEYDVPSDHLTWTNEVYRIMGMEPGNPPAGVDFASKYFPEHAELMQTAFSKAVNHAEPYDLELKLLREDGSSLWVRSMGNPVVKDGKVVRVSGNFMDISKQKQSEQALKDTKRLLEETQAIAKMGGWEYDIASGLMAWTKELYHILDLDPSRPALSVEFASRFYPEHAGLLQTAFWRSVNHAEAYDLELKRVKNDGSIAWIRNTAKPVIKDGKVVRISGYIIDITDQKKTENDLKETKRLLEETQAIAKMGGWEYDVAADHFTFTDEFSRIHGVDRNDLISDLSEINDAMKFYPPEDSWRAKQAFLTAAEQGVPYDIEVKAFHKDETIWVRIMGQPVLKENKVHRVVGYMMDITDRKQAEYALNETKRLLEETQTIAKIGGWEYDVASNHFTFTDEFSQIHGVDRNDLISDLSEINDAMTQTHYPPEDWQKVKQAFMAAVEQGIPYDFEVKAFRKDETIWIRIMGQPVIKEDKVLRIVGYIMDITERKQAEEMLRKYEKIVNTSQDSINIINADYVYEAANEAFLKNRNKTREEIIGRTVADEFGEETFQKNIKPFIDRALTGEVVHHRDTFHVANQGIRLMDVGLFPITRGDDTVEGVVVNARDITDTRKLEEQLMQIQKIESIGTLAGGVAHEINNPINGIMNFAQLIMDRLAEQEPARKFAHEIIRETDRIATIVRNLLTFARHEHQSHSPVLLSDIISSVLSLVQTVIRHDQIDLTVDIPDDLPKIKCRNQEIQQVLMNLMTNARDALNERYPGYDPNKKLQIHAQQVLQNDRPFIRTTIEDTGTGIQPETRDRLFDPFFTTKPKETGTGLGLSISYSIVKDHKGALTVESEPGSYTRFHVDLPLDNEWDLSEK